MESRRGKSGNSGKEREKNFCYEIISWESFVWSLNGIARRFKVFRTFRVLTVTADPQAVNSCQPETLKSLVKSSQTLQITWPIATVSQKLVNFQFQNIAFFLFQNIRNQFDLWVRLVNGGGGQYIALYKFSIRQTNVYSYYIWQKSQHFEETNGWNQTYSYPDYLNLLPLTLLLPSI